MQFSYLKPALIHEPRVHVVHHAMRTLVAIHLDVVLYGWLQSLQLLFPLPRSCLWGFWALFFCEPCSHGFLFSGLDAEASISASAILLVFSSTAGLFNFFPDWDLISQFGYLYCSKSASSHPGGALGSCGYWAATLTSASLLASYVILEKSFWMQFSKALLKVSKTSAPQLLQPFRTLFCVFVVCLSSHLSS